MTAVPRVLVVGSANVDYTVAVARLPQPGETVSGGTLVVDHGGKGANQAVAARRLGADVRFIGCVGDDAAGAALRTGLAREGVGTAGMVVASGAATGTALIVVDGEGRNQIAVAPGANRLLTAEQVRARAGDFEWAEVVVCQLETPLPAVRAALEAARGRRRLTILNPAPVPDEPLDVWALVDYLTPNAGEAARLAATAAAPDGAGGALPRAPAPARDAAPDAAARALLARGVGVVVVTLGADGVLAATGTGTLRVPAFRVPVVDTTAAGDAFTGGLAVALAEGQSLPAALRFACAAAALACTRRGAQGSLPARAEVERLLAAGA